MAVLEAANFSVTVSSVLQDTDQHFANEERQKSCFYEKHGAVEPTGKDRNRHWGVLALWFDRFAGPMLEAGWQGLSKKLFRV